MQIVLPVAGFGSRLRPQTWSRPKPLVTVAGKTLIDHVLDRLAVLNPERVVFITGYLGDQIEAHVREHYDFDAVFVEQKEMLGQTHALLQARDAISGPVMVLFPDMIFEADLSIVQASNDDGILWVMPVEDPSRFGVVVKDGERVTRLVEKPDEPISNLAVMGIYYFRDAERLIETIERQIASDIITKGEYFIADAIQMLIDDGAVFTTSDATVWQDAGTTEALLDTNRYLLDRSATTDTHDGALVIQPSLIDATATIKGSVIGPYASVGPHAVVSASIIRDSIVDAGSSVQNVNVAHSIVGRDAVVRGASLVLNIGDTSVVDLRASDDA
jgi:glucose-1-phosphate thymidylyltransferase